MLLFLILFLSLKQESASPFMQIPMPARGSWVSPSSLSSWAMQEHHSSQTPSEKADLIPHPQTPVTLSSEHREASQAGPGPSHSIFLAPNSLTTHLSPDTPSSVWPSWRSDGPQMLLGSEPSVTLTEVPRAMRAEQDPAWLSGSPFPPGKLSGETVNSTESTEPNLREPASVSEELPMLTRPFMSSLAEEGLIFHHAPRRPQETLPVIRAQESGQNDHNLPREGARMYLDLSTSESSRDMEGLGLTISLGTDATFSTPRRRQPDARVHLGTSGPEPAGRRRVGPAALQTPFAMGLLASTTEKPAAPSRGGADRTLQSAPTRPEGWYDLGAAHRASPLSSHTQSLRLPTGTMLPHSGEPGSPLLDGQEAVESRLAPTPESHQSPEL